MKIKGLLTAAIIMTTGSAMAQERFITVASTTSTEQSGLFAHILPIFTAKSGITVKVVAQGTGQALKTAERGDADVVLVHDRVAEDKFVAAGFGIERQDVMANDFVLVGPATDPAKIKGGKNAKEAMSKIAATKAAFVSRGDNSGTHASELRFWKAVNVDPKNLPSYKESGTGMGETLNIAAALDGYTLADRGTWASFGNRRNLTILVEGDVELFNPYGVIIVNPARHPNVKAKDGKIFADWLTSAEGKTAIASFKLKGEQLFFPSGGK
jgi:tungstate transport system substrate-binding protein